MMKLAVFTVAIACLIGSIASSKYCSKEDADNVLHSWNGIMEGGNTAPIMLSTFLEVFKGIYRRSPESRELFGRVNVADMESPLYHAHVLRVANGFDDLLNKLHNHKVLDNMLSHLAEAHAVRNGLKKVYFEDLAVELNKVLDVVLDSYDQDAWHNCVSGVLDGMSHSLP